MGFGSEDRDNDFLQCPEWKYKLRNTFAFVDATFNEDLDLVDQSRGEVLELSLATEGLQSRVLLLYAVFAKVLKSRPLDLVHPGRPQPLRGFQKVTERP